MIQPVAALGAAMLTLSGSVWYLPALSDLRAGADRPDSRRTAAAACLSGWSTTGLVALLLLAAEAWWVPGGVAATGAVVTVCLLGRAGVQRRREVREAARDWAELGTGPLPSARARTVVLVLLAAGLITALATAVVSAREGWSPLIAAAPAVVTVAVAVGYARVARRP
ncbi:hypothetical protein OG616_01855 [Streptomyces antibioticus]|uniref:hypothetical protein n=1 Tax=Streptomyces antibioticus TaxID=1890 RepID=UPI0022553FFB|nr:hypothetical protein [Streptomyces antibioticus]MCX5166759.1 hypothetical protein [Streptomyces antibioticus]